MKKLLKFTIMTIKI